MPISCHIDAKANYALLQGSGIVTDEEYLSMVEEMYAHPGFNPQMRSLVDLREVTENRITPEALEKTARVSRFHPKTKRAVIVGTTTDFHLAREHQSLLSLHAKSRPRIFHSAREALDFINEGFPPDQHIG